MELFLDPFGGPTRLPNSSITVSRPCTAPDRPRCSSRKTVTLSMSASPSGSVSSAPPNYPDRRQADADAPVACLRSRVGDGGYRVLVERHVQADLVAGHDLELVDGRQELAPGRASLWPER